MINDFGSFALLLSFLTSVTGVLLGTTAGVLSLADREDQRSFTSRLTQCALRSTQMTALLSGFSLFCLAYAFGISDFTNQYIWQHSDRAMPFIYKVSAVWGGMDGSMLLWAAVTSFSAALVTLGQRAYPKGLTPWLMSVLSLNSLFFLAVTTFLTNPFRYITVDFIPQDGNGLNPLLQNPYMAIHPPLLYLGFTTFAIPFAFCMAALLSKRLDNQWLRLTRTWTLTAWGFLTVGIVMGGHWAYLELGWGGFWAWDPVENSSFLPWLTGTAFLHSVMVQERKGMLKIWNVWLIVLTYSLTVLGTFLTRSGVVQSVHAFAATDIGWVFLGYLGLLIGGATLLTVSRYSHLKSERQLESVFSRESAFLANNLVLLSICFATLWGVLFPVLSEWVTGKKHNVGIPFFNSVNIPFFMALIFLMGVGPLLAWRKATFQNVRKVFLLPFIISFLSTGVLVLSGITQFWALLSYGLCWFVFLTLLSEFHRGVKAQKKGANYLDSTKRLLRKHHTRYGGYLVHLGVLVMTIGITASMAHKLEKSFTLKMNEDITIRRFTLSLKDLKENETKNYFSLIGDLQVSDAGSGADYGVLQPELRRYKKSGESTTEVAIRMGWWEDLYVVLAGLNETGTEASLKVFVNPLQIWLWIGTLITVLGTIIALLPRLFVQKLLPVT